VFFYIIKLNGEGASPLPITHPLERFYWGSDGNLDAQRAHSDKVNA